MGSSQPSGPAMVAAAADADPVTLLVTAWLSTRRSANTRAAYARDIGITPQQRPGRAPSWLTWCQQQEVHPVTGVTALHVVRYARQLDNAGLRRRQRGPQARRHLQLVRLAGPARAHHREPRRRPRPAPPRPVRPARPGPHSGPGPRAHGRGRHRARRPARPQRGPDRRPAAHQRPAQRNNRRRRRRPRHQRRAPGAMGHPRQRPATGPAPARPGRGPDRRLPRLPGSPAGDQALFATRTGGRLFDADVRSTLRRLATRAGLPADQTRHLGPRTIRQSATAPHLSTGRGG